MSNSIIKNRAIIILLFVLSAGNSMAQVVRADLLNNLTGNATPVNDNCDMVANLAAAQAYLNSHYSVYRPAGAIHTFEDNLTSTFTFKKLVKKNFNELVLGNENISKIGRYASVSITDKTSFDFSPFIFEDGAETDAYNNIVSVNFSGKLNADKYFDFKNFREISGGFTWTHLFTSGWLASYVPNDNAAALREVIKCKRSIKINELVAKYTPTAEAIDNLCTPSCTALVASQKQKLAEKFIADYEDIEIETAEDYWDKKNFLWTNLNVNFLSWDNFSYLEEKDIPANYSPKKESVYTPSITGSINYFEAKHKWFVSLSAGAKLRHSLSEVFEPKNFQNYVPVNDNVMQLKETEDVFVIDFSTIERKVKANYDVRLIKFFSALDDKFNIGLTYSFSHKGLVSANSNSNFQKTELGIIIPMKNSDGDDKFNFEIFHHWDVYNNFPNDNEKGWGFRFNVPLNN